MLNMFNIEIFPQRLKQVKHDFQQNIFDFDKVERRRSFIYLRIIWQISGQISLCLKCFLSESVRSMRKGILAK